MVIKGQTLRLEGMRANRAHNIGLLSRGINTRTLLINVSICFFLWHPPSVEQAHLGPKGDVSGNIQSTLGNIPSILGNIQSTLGNIESTSTQQGWRVLST
jgi:hypothetical protein